MGNLQLIVDAAANSMPLHNTIFNVQRETTVILQKGLKAYTISDAVILFKNQLTYYSVVKMYH